MAFNHRRADFLSSKFWIFFIAFQPCAIIRDLKRTDAASERRQSTGSQLTGIDVKGREEAVNRQSVNWD